MNHPVFLHYTSSILADTESTERSLPVNSIGVNPAGIVLHPCLATNYRKQGLDELSNTYSFKKIDGI
jgi:hypothetical protein